jgi:hypothetical protein
MVVFRAARAGRIRVKDVSRLIFVEDADSRPFFAREWPLSPQPGVPAAPDNSGGPAAAALPRRLKSVGGGSRSGHAAHMGICKACFSPAHCRKHFREVAAACGIPNGFYRGPLPRLGGLPNWKNDPAPLYAGACCSVPEFAIGLPSDYGIEVLKPGR